MNAFVAALAVLTVLANAHAQSSSSFQISNSVVNAGGHPQQGQKMESASYQVSLDAIGDAVWSGASATYASGSGFVGRYRPPGELGNLRFTAKINLTWNYDTGLTKSNLYRGATAAGAACYQPNLPGNSFLEPASPSADTGWYYLVGAENLLGEEGPLGTGPGGAPRAPSAPCP
jgi:hypothetical protein